MSFNAILTLTPYFFSILLLLFEKITFGVGQLRFVCFPVHFEKTIYVLVKLAGNFKMKLVNFNFHFFETFKQFLKKLGYKR